MKRHLYNVINSQWRASAKSDLTKLPNTYRKTGNILGI